MIVSVFYIVKLECIHLTILCNLKYDPGTSIIDFMSNWILTFSRSMAKNQSAKKKFHFHRQGYSINHEQTATQFTW